MTISFCLKFQSWSVFTEEIRRCPCDFLSLYICDNPLNHEGADTLMCLCLWREKCQKIFVFVQVSLSLKLWSLAGVFMYIMYIVVYTVCDIRCTGCPLTHSCIRNRDIWRASWCKSQPKVCLCICVYTLKVHTWVCMYNTVRLAWGRLVAV